MLTTHDSIIPYGEICIKIYGCHGCDSFKLCIQVANLKKPNSKTTQSWSGLQKLKTCMTIYVLYLKSLVSLILSVCNEQLAEGKYQWIWCLKTRGKMQSYFVQQNPQKGQCNNNYSAVRLKWTLWDQRKVFTLSKVHFNHYGQNRQKC